VNTDGTCLEGTGDQNSVPNSNFLSYENFEDKDGSTDCVSFFHQFDKFICTECSPNFTFDAQSRCVDDSVISGSDTTANVKNCIKQRGSCDACAEGYFRVRFDGLSTDTSAIHNALSIDPSQPQTSKYCFSQEEFDTLLLDNPALSVTSKFITSRWENFSLEALDLANQPDCNYKINGYCHDVVDANKVPLYADINRGSRDITSTAITPAACVPDATTFYEFYPTEQVCSMAPTIAYCKV
jgi:hypothetical protein